VKIQPQWVVTSGKQIKPHVYNRGGQGPPRAVEHMMMMIFMKINSYKVPEQR